MNFEPLLIREEGATLVVTMNRPEALNALNQATVKSLGEMISWAEGQTHLRAMIITGAGEKAFVAGADIKEFESLNTGSAAEYARAGQKLFTRLETLKIPVIAAVNGFALGGGLELALACDFIYAADNAKFGLPEATLGIMPGFGGTVRLPARVGVARAREMTYTGGMITAAEALNYGLVNKVVPQAELLASALEVAKQMSLKVAPGALARIKKSLHDGASLSEEKANELEARLFGELFATEDKAEGVRAFVEKRKPQFTGR